MEEVGKLAETKELIVEMVGETNNNSVIATSQDLPESEMDAVSKLLARKRGDNRMEDTTPVVKEFLVFEAKPPVSNDVDRLEYWLALKDELPLLFKVAQEVLGVPCSSAKSERVFSSAGLVSNLYILAVYS